MRGGQQGLSSRLSLRLVSFLCQLTAMFLRVIPFFLAPPLLELKIKGQKFSFQKVYCHFLPHLL